MQILIFLIIFLILLLMIAQKRGIPVFLYHEINNDSKMTPQLLEEEFKIIKRKKMNCITIEKATNIVNNGEKIEKNSIILTFDDGLKDNYTNIYPLLKKYDLCATVFVNTAFINKDAEYLTWEEMQKSSDLIDYQAHTHRHNRNFYNTKLIGIYGVFNELLSGTSEIYGRDPEKGDPIFLQTGEVLSRKTNFKKEFFENFFKFYKEKLIDLDKKNALKLGQNYIDTKLKKDFSIESNSEFKKRVEEDISLNKELLEKKLNKKIVSFAWPWGKYNKNSMKWIANLGIQSFVTCIRGTNKRSMNLKWIRRQSIQNPTLFKFKIRLFISQNLILGYLYEKLSTKNLNWEENFED